MLLTTILAACSTDIYELDSPENAVHNFYHGLNNNNLETIQRSMTEESFRNAFTENNLTTDDDLERMFEVGGFRKVQYRIQTTVELNSTARILALQVKYGDKVEEESFLIEKTLLEISNSRS